MNGLGTPVEGELAALLSRIGIDRHAALNDLIEAWGGGRLNKNTLTDQLRGKTQRPNPLFVALLRLLEARQAAEMPLTPVVVARPDRNALLAASSAASDGIDERSVALVRRFADALAAGADVDRAARKVALVEDSAPRR